MLVYGDRLERVVTAARLDALAESARRIAAMPAGLARHSALVGLFIDMAGLTQGVADALFAADGQDRRSEAQDACLALLMDLAAAVRTSWESDFAEIGSLLDIRIAVPLPDEVEIRIPEGYAFYALYPEAYVEAARQLSAIIASPLEGEEGLDIHLIGIRSIGTGLAALAASVLGAAAPVTLRPTGHPFARNLSVSPDLAAELLAAPAIYVIVDEGPGLSGSSFGAVADFLEDHGVPPDRIAFLPGHAGGLGPQSSARHRTRWVQAARPVVDTDALLLDRLTGWASDLLGPLDAPLLDISGGRWRALFLPDGADWPPAHPSWERRKFLARAGGETWLLKFAGLGAIGERKLARARALHAAGFVPEPRGLLHGFLVERWHGEARPGGTPDLHWVARYLAFRARMFPAAEGQGATLAELFEMARYNMREALGESAAAELDRWWPMLPDLSAGLRSVEIDGRCAPHEWLRLPDGRLLKADALDHHAAHDLIGCQDIAWDIAGATVELGLPGLGQAVAHYSGRPVDPQLVAFMTFAYRAFRLGCSRMAPDNREFVCV